VRDCVVLAIGLHTKGYPLVSCGTSKLPYSNIFAVVYAAPGKNNVFGWI
jgi:hypothetical protein